MQGILSRERAHLPLIGCRGPGCGAMSSVRAFSLVIGDAGHGDEGALRVPLAPWPQQGHAWWPGICCNGIMSDHESARRFATALDHLGSNDPVVRVGCFAEMDRLVAEDSEYAQGVADVVTAYLRMPFDPPRYHSHSREFIMLPKVPDEPPMSQAPGFPELQVRLAAQAVLTRRLLPEMAPQADAGGGGELAVPDVLIDLTGAALVGINFTGRQLHDDVIFSDAGFHEYVKFPRQHLLVVLGSGTRPFTGLCRLIGLSFRAPPCLRTPSSLAGLVYRISTVTGRFTAQTLGMHSSGSMLILTAQNSVIT
jgi:hypothetical protein